MLDALVRERAEVNGFSVYIWNGSEMLQLACELKMLLPAAAGAFSGDRRSLFAARAFLWSIRSSISSLPGKASRHSRSYAGSSPAAELPPRLIWAEPYRAFPDGGIYYDKIGAAPRGLVYYESVRGCPFSCAYCLSSVTEGLRAKSAEHALSDLLAFEQFDGIRTVKLVDRTFNYDRVRARTIWCRAFRRVIHKGISF